MYPFNLYLFLSLVPSPMISSNCSMESDYPGRLVNYHMSFWGGQTTSTSSTSSTTSSLDPTSLSSPTISSRDIIFLYRLVKGHCPLSYGLNVARLAGVPSSVLEKAQLMANHMMMIEQQRAVQATYSLANNIRNILQQYKNQRSTNDSRQSDEDVELKLIEEAKNARSHWLSLKPTIIQSSLFNDNKAA